jgi:hypothetical protein
MQSDFNYNKLPEEVKRLPSGIFDEIMMGIP